MRKRGFVLVVALAQLTFQCFAEGLQPPVTAKGVEEAIESLGSEDLKTRKGAFDRLLEWTIADPSILERLPFTHTDPEIRFSLASLASRAKRERCRRELLRLTGSQAFEENFSALFDVPTHNAVGKAFRFVNDSKEKEGLRGSFTGYISEFLLEHEDDHVRMEVVRALGRLREKSAAASLVKHLADSHPGVRCAAADALSLMEERSAVPSLVSLLGDDMVGVRVAAALALGHLGDRSASSALMKLLAGAGDLNVRSAAANALSHLGEKSAAPLIAGLLKSDDPNVRWEAARNLGRVSGNAWESSEKGVRSACAWWEGHKDDPEFAAEK